MVYNFIADPIGTAFWHAHFHSENVDGLYGPLIVDDNNGSFPFDFDEEQVILFTESYDNSSWALEQYMDTPPTPEHPQPHSDPTPNHGLLCLYDESNLPATPSCSSSSTGEGFNLKFQPGKTYRLRIISASNLSPFQFSIDEHELQIIATDYTVVDGSAWVTSLPIFVRFDLHVSFIALTSDLDWSEVRRTCSCP
jgi:iron transport multicopper oxidase